MKAQYFVRKPIKIYKDWKKLTPFSESDDTLRSGNKVVLLKKMEFEDIVIECGSIGIFYKTIVYGMGIGVQFDRLIVPCHRKWVAKYKNKTKTKV